jgi:dipeptidyl-peptidase-4
MARFTLPLIAAVLTAAAPAAESAVTNLEVLRQYAATRGFMLGRPVKPQPTPDGSAVLFLRSEARSPKQSLYEFNVATKQTRELLSPAKLLGGTEENLSPEEKARRERQRVSAGGFTDYQLSDDGKLVLVSLSGRLYVLERASGRAAELQTGPGPLIDPKYSPDGGRVAYVRDHDVHVYDLATKRDTRVTTGGTREKTHGLAEFVAQEEMHRHSGYWWSPDGKHIAYEEADAAGVEVWYVADPAHPEQPPQSQYYPRPGKKNVAVRLGVVPAAGGATVWVEWDRAKYEYLANVVWKDGPLTLVVQDRKQQTVAVLAADASSGKVIELLTESDSAWVNLSPKMPQWLDANRFFWIADRNDEAALCLVDLRGASGDRVKRVSPPQLHVIDLVHILRGSEENPAPIYTATDSPPHVGVWTGSGIATGRRLAYQSQRPLGPGVTVTTFSKDITTRAVTRTSLTELPRTFVEHESGAFHVPVTDLPSVAEEPPFKPNVSVQQIGDFWTVIVRPRDFDPAKKYPVVVDVYGGPRHLHVVAAMRNWLLPQWLADQGFVVVAIDGRGTPHRGRDWERAVYQKFGSVPLEDQVAGLQALGKRFPELDLTRVGIVGWSFGGYLSALAVLKRPDVFHAAVAGAPVCDWLDYDTHYTERYLGLPQEHPEAYREASLLTYADKLSRPLLIVHGTADDNVFFRHSLRLTDALFRAGKEFEVLPLPGLTHMVPDPVVTERLWTRIASHFRKHLGAPVTR